jgi:hypothetical protein
MTNVINPLNTELNPICHLITLRGGARYLGFSRVRVKEEIQANDMYRCASISVGNTFQDYCGYVELLIVTIAICNVICE